MAIRCTIRLLCWQLPEALCCHGDGSDGRHVYKVSWPYVLLSGYYVANSDFVVAMAMVVMGCMCVHSITAIHTTITAMLQTVFYSLRLFAMAMVVVGHISTWSYTTLIDPLPEAICVAMATCNFVGTMLLTSIISNALCQSSLCCLMLVHNALLVYSLVPRPSLLSAHYTRAGFVQLCAWKAWSETGRRVGGVAPK